MPQNSHHILCFSYIIRFIKAPPPNIKAELNQMNSGFISDLQEYSFLSVPTYEIYSQRQLSENFAYILCLIYCAFLTSSPC